MKKRSKLMSWSGSRNREQLSCSQLTAHYLGIHHLGHVPPEIATIPSGRLWHGVSPWTRPPSFWIFFWMFAWYLDGKVAKSESGYCMNNRQRGVFRQRNNSSVSRKQSFSKLRSYPCPCFDDETNINWLVKPPPIKPTYHTTGFTPDYVPMTSHDSQS
jgi:hypothetical protein